MIDENEITTLREIIDNVGADVVGNALTSRHGELQFKKCLGDMKANGNDIVTEIVKIMSSTIAQQMDEAILNTIVDKEESLKRFRALLNE